MKLISSAGSMNAWLIDWLIDWFIDWLIDWFCSAYSEQYFSYIQDVESRVKKDEKNFNNI